MSDIEEDVQPEVVEGEEEEDEHAEQVEGEEEEGEEEAETTEEPQPETDQKSEPVEDKNDENGEKKSILDSTLKFTKQLSTSKMKEMIGLENLTENATTMLKKLTPAVLTGQEAPQQPTIVVSARMKELKDTNDEARKLLQTKYANLLKGINREVVALNVPLTRTLNVSQEISYHIRSLNEDLQALTNQISELEFGPVL